MKTYELMVVLRSDYPIDDEKKRDALLSQLVKSGKVTRVDVLGKKKLAYPIQKQAEGIYLLATIESEGIHASDIEREVKMGTDVLRYLLIHKKEGK